MDEIILAGVMAWVCLVAFCGIAFIAIRWNWIFVFLLPAAAGVLYLWVNEFAVHFIR